MTIALFVGAGCRYERRRKMREKCVIKSINDRGDETYFYSLNGMFASSWRQRSEAQVFNSEETAECIVKSLKERHKKYLEYEIEKLENGTETVRL